MEEGWSLRKVVLTKGKNPPCHRHFMVSQAAPSIDLLWNFSLTILLNSELQNISTVGLCQRLAVINIHQHLFGNPLSRI
jgi:hypothetical protein